MDSPGRRTSAKNMLLSVTGRLVVGYLIFRAFNATRVTESASVSDSNDSCSASKLRESINRAIAASAAGKTPVGQVAVELFRQCNSQFVQMNSVSQEVKETVDTWLDMKLDQLDAKELFVAYQQALLNQRPEKISDKFKDDCKSMLAAYESFRDNTIELARYVDVSSGALLAEDGQVSADERALFNFAQYSQFCSLLSEPNRFQ